ncbi:DUF1566 domain-containing protein [bacterium]|nr:DUF1566 domain-containing protein [bacterium]
MKKIVVFLLFLLIFGTLSAWDEFNQYSIADELKKPGVKLVAVDFYATWCEPCNAAIPKWKKLQEKYGDKGFKLIVVSVQSEGSCSQPPQWNPDKIVCDYDGDIADAWHANDLPQAFLWSWQGNLLVAHGGVDNVAAAIEKYFKKIPRVYVEEGADKDIYQLVRSKLRENSKIEIVASDTERKALAELRKKSSNMNYDSKLKCELGEEISANSRLVISKQKRGKKNALVLELFSAEKGCLTASGSSTMRGNVETEVAEAVYNLLKNLLGTVSMPGEKEKPEKNKLSRNMSQNSQDEYACNYAKQKATISVWNQYLEDFPKGGCAEVAHDEIDKMACEHAEKNKSIEAWELYLKHQSQGKCAFKAKAEIKELKKEIEREYIKKGRKIGNLIWSDRSANQMDWSSAKQYCDDLTEGGYTDWRLPNIDELRTTIKNCSKTETGGQCKVSERNGCLSSSCWNPDGSCYCEYKKNNGGYYSKLGDDDNVMLWSSSVPSDYSSLRWYVYFDDGHVGDNDVDNDYYVRCVR